MENSGPVNMFLDINSLGSSLIIKISDVENEPFQNTTKIKLVYERVKREKVCFTFVLLSLSKKKKKSKKSHIIISFAAQGHKTIC